MYLEKDELGVKSSQMRIAVALKGLYTLSECVKQQISIG